MLAFKLAVADSLSKFQMVDSVIDDFKDSTGIDTANSTNEISNTNVAGAEYIHGGVAAGFVAQSQSGNTVSNQNGYSQSLTNQLASNPSACWDTSDGQSWNGKYYRNDYGSAKIMRRGRYRATNNQLGGYIQASNDNSSWSTIHTFSPANSAAGTYGLEYEFANNAAYRYWGFYFNSSTTDTTGSDACYMEFATSDVSIDQLTLVSTSTTAEETATTGDLVVLIEDSEGTSSLGTDIKGYISRNGNANYSGEVTLVDEGNWGTNKRIITARGVDLSSLAGTTDMRYKLTTHNQSAGSKEVRIHAVSLAWS